MNREPALIRTAIVTIVAQALSVGITLGLLHLDPTQVGVINTAVALVSAAIAALWVRQGVTPVAAPDPNVVAVEQQYVVETPAITNAIGQATGAVPVTPPAPVEDDEPTTPPSTVVPDAAKYIED